MLAEHHILSGTDTTTVKTETRHLEFGKPTTAVSYRKQIK